MESATLEASRREELGSRAAQRLRRGGLVPAVLYGHNLDPVHLALPLKGLERLFHQGTRMVNIQVGDLSEPALIREVQYDLMGDHIIHVDLVRVALDEKVTVTVPVELHGLAKGVASGGTLDHVIQDVEVRCLPSDIPERIRLEISDLDIGQIIHVRDLEPPPGVEIVHDPDATVVTIHPPVTAEVAVEAEAAEAAAEPEVIESRRKEEVAGGEEKGPD